MPARPRGPYLAAGGPLTETLVELVAAAAQGTGAEVAVLWLPTPEHDLAARAVWATSAGLAAELEGLRVTAAEGASSLVRGRLDDGAEALTVAVDSAHGAGVLQLARRGDPFERDETWSPTSRPSSAARRPAGRGRAMGPGGNGALDVAGDALAAVAADDGAPARVARLAVVAPAVTLRRLAAPRREARRRRLLRRDRGGRPAPPRCGGDPEASRMLSVTGTDLHRL